MKRKNEKIVKYKVTGAFGDDEEGSIINAILLLKGHGHESALLYHPRTPGNCASIEMCKLSEEEEDDVYISLDSKSDMFGWINIESQLDLNKLVRKLSKISYRDTRRRESK